MEGGAVSATRAVSKRQPAEVREEEGVPGTALPRQGAVVVGAAAERGGARPTDGAMAPPARRDGGRRRSEGEGAGPPPPTSGGAQGASGGEAGMLPPNGHSGVASVRGRGVQSSLAQPGASEERRGGGTHSAPTSEQQHPAARTLEGSAAGRRGEQRGRCAGEGQRKRPRRTGAAAAAVRGTGRAPVVLSPAELRGAGRRRGRTGLAAAAAPATAAPSSRSKTEGVMLRKRRRRGATSGAAAEGRPSRGIVLADSAGREGASSVGAAASQDTARDSGGEEEAESLFLSVPPPGSHPAHGTASSAAAAASRRHSSDYTTAAAKGRAYASHAAVRPRALVHASRLSGAGAATQAALAALAAQQSALAGSEARRDAHTERPVRGHASAPQEAPRPSQEHYRTWRAQMPHRAAPRGTAQSDERPRAAPASGHAARWTGAPRLGGGGWRGSGSLQWAGRRPGAQKRVVDYAGLQSMLR